MGVPTHGEVFAELIEHLIKAQEACAKLAFLTGLQGSKMDHLLEKGWLGVAELLKKMQHQVTKLAQGKLH